MKTGIIVLGHGSKAPQALETLKGIKEMVAAELPGFEIEVASMEFNHPDLSEAVTNLVDKGMNRIIIAPFFLFYGIHMQEDIPELIEQERVKYPQVELILAGHLGSDGRLAAILTDRIREVS